MESFQNTTYTEICVSYFYVFGLPIMFSGTTSLLPERSWIHWLFPLQNSSQVADWVDSAERLRQSSSNWNLAQSSTQGPEGFQTFVCFDACYIQPVLFFLREGEMCLSPDDQGALLGRVFIISVSIQYNELWPCLGHLNKCSGLFQDLALWNKTLFTSCNFSTTNIKVSKRRNGSEKSTERCFQTWENVHHRCSYFQFWFQMEF